MNKDNIPTHIAFIMDGNGRWAKEKGLPRTLGHREGTERVKDIIRASNDFGVKFITFYAFSAENWKRPKKEIEVLMKYLDHFLTKEMQELDKNNMRFVCIGKDDPIPEYLQKKIRDSERKTAENTGMTVVLALNYGSRQEIVDAARIIASRVAKGEMKLNQIDEERFAECLYTAGIPDPDLLIRTSGEMRISNYLLWQLSYAELYFINKKWPDFRKDDLKEAIQEYQRRERRFGGI